MFAMEKTSGASLGCDENLAAKKFKGNVNNSTVLVYESVCVSMHQVKEQVRDPCLYSWGK